MDASFCSKVLRPQGGRAVSLSLFLPGAGVGGGGACERVSVCARPRVRVDNK